MWVLVEHSLVFHDSRTSLENSREKEGKRVSNFCLSGEYNGLIEK